MFWSRNQIKSYQGILYLIKYKFILLIFIHCNIYMYSIMNNKRKFWLTDWPTLTDASSSIWFWLIFCLVDLAGIRCIRAWWFLIPYIFAHYRWEPLCDPHVSWSKRAGGHEMAIDINFLSEDEIQTRDMNKSFRNIHYEPQRR